MPTWTLEDFVLRFDLWVEQDDPSDDWRFFVLEWIHSLLEDPYRNATRRTNEFGTAFWLCEPAGDSKHAVICSYQIDEEKKLARCTTITTLRRPLAD
jgi:hypothetical protein